MERWGRQGVGGVENATDAIKPFNELKNSIRDAVRKYLADFFR